MSDQDKTPRYPTAAGVGLSRHVVWQDFIVLEDRLHDNPRYSDKQHQEAVEYLADKWFEKPIARQRWNAFHPALRDELNARAKEFGTTWQTELKKCVVQSFLIAVDAAGGIMTPEPRKAFLKKLNDLVTEDLLGPGWRRRHKNVGLEDLLAEGLDNVLPHLPSHGGEVEAKLDLEAAMAKAALTEIEVEIVEFMRRGESLADVAKNLGIREGTARQRLHRARNKMSKIRM